MLQGSVIFIMYTSLPLTLLIYRLMVIVHFTQINVTPSPVIYSLEDKFLLL